MSNLVNYAKSEMDRIGLNDGDEYNKMMYDGVVEIVETFSEQGHSGFSASYALRLLRRLLDYKPLTELTGEDDEWNEIADGMFQNKRYSSVFKDNDGKAYNIDGIVFYDTYTDEDGKEQRSYFTTSDSRVFIEFPYEVPDSPEYKEAS